MEFTPTEGSANTLFCGTPKSENNLGGNLYFGDNSTFTPEVYNYIIKRFGVKTILDVGSGRGHLPLFLSEEFNVKVIGMEGFLPNIENSVYPLVHCDLTKNSFKTSKVDLVTCVEVVEHVAEKHISNLMDTLTQGEIVLMTHALPGENGRFHVNEQSDQYWVEKFAERNFVILPNETVQVRKLDKFCLRGSGYFAKSGLVFGRLPKYITVKEVLQK